MAENDDALAALASREVPVRAASARDLAASGGAESLEPLLRLAVEDPSPAVRLVCASAAADVLSRHRLGPAASEVPEARRAELLQHVAGSDPSHNVGLFQVCGALGTPAALKRILIGVRDPRADVRAGAVVGLLRFATSAASPDDLEATLVPLLTHERVRPETRAELARAAASLGYWSALEPARVLADSPARGVAQAAAEAVARLARPPGPDGLWVDLGVDAGEARPDAAPVAYVATEGQHVHRLPISGGPVERSARPARVRQLLLRRPGSRDAAVEVLQIGGRTLWAQDADEQVDFGDALVRASAYGTMRAIDPILPASASTFRLRGVVALHDQQPEVARVALEAAVEMKRCPLDAHYFLAQACVALGHPADALAPLERYLSRAPKRAALLAEARALHASLAPNTPS